MLKTEQIANAKFTPFSAGAYSADEVDNFLKAVAESYDQNIREKNELLKKMSILADKVEKYRDDEEAIKLALLDARRTAESVTKEAEQKSAALLSGAQTKAGAIVESANIQATQSIDDARAQAKGIVDNAKVAVASLTDRAQQETSRAIVAAQTKAEEIIAQANKKAEYIVGNSKKEYDFYSAELEKIKAEASQLKAKIQQLCSDQLSIVSAVPDYVPAEKAEFVPEEAPAVEEAAAPVIETPEIKLDDIPVVDEIPENLKVEETAEEETVVEAEEEAVSSVDDDEMNELLASFGDEEPVSLELASDIDNLMPDIPSFEDIVPAEKAEEKAEDDELDLGLESLDELKGDDEDDDDITSLFDSLF